MIGITAEHLSLLATREFWAVDLYAIRFIDGSVVRYSSHPLSTTWGGHVYAGGGPLFSRGETKQVRGLETDTLSVEITPRETDTLFGLPFAKAIRNGALDGASFELYRGHSAKPGDPIVGAVLKFSGLIEEVDGDLTIRLTCKDTMMRLDASMPRDVWQAGCSRTLYGAGCKAQRAAYQYVGDVVLGSTRSVVKVASLPKIAGYYSGGELRFFSGENAGARRTVKFNADTGTLQLSYPLLSIPSVGDRFNLWPGCAHTWAECSGKFCDGTAFNGQPFIPDPETAY